MRGVVTRGGEQKIGLGILVEDTLWSASSWDELLRGMLYNLVLIEA